MGGIILSFKKIPLRSEKEFVPSPGPGLLLESGVVDWAGQRPRGFILVQNDVIWCPYMAVIAVWFSTSENRASMSSGFPSISNKERLLFCR